MDGIGYDRQAMKRVAKVLYWTTCKHPCRMQFHCNDCYGEQVHPGPTSYFMEHFPYVNDLWFGEQFDYNLSPDYWLLEISGIPFGLTGEMLQGGGNAYQGMIYGMTSRLHPSHPAMWKFWDELGIQEAEMIGYWDEDCPVTTNGDDILATVYRKADQTLVALASWSDASTEVALDINWPALGLDPATATLTASPIAHFQEAAEFAPDEAIPVEMGKGWLLILED